MTRRHPWVEDQEELRRRLALLARVVELRKAGRMEPVWVDAWRVYLRLEPFDYPSSPRSQAEITWDELRELADAAEGQAVRMPVRREVRAPAELAAAG